MAINLPLTPARIGACSTRSVHPQAISLLNEVLLHLGLPCRVVNPVAHLTKGQMCREAVERDGLDPRILADSISCGKPYTYGKEPYGNCGYCYPCLVRHASLMAAGADLTEYRLSPDDLRAGRGSDVERADLTALRTWLTAPEPTESDLIAASRWPPGADLTAHLAVISRGREELRDAWLR